MKIIGLKYLWFTKKNIVSVQHYLMNSSCINLRRCLRSFIWKIICKTLRTLSIVLPLNHYLYSSGLPKSYLYEHFNVIYGHIISAILRCMTKLFLLSICWWWFVPWVCNTCSTLHSSCCTSLSYNYLVRVVSCWR